MKRGRMPIAWVASVMDKPEDNKVSLKVLDFPRQNHYIDERLQRLVIEIRQSENDYTPQILEEIASYIGECEDHPFLDQCFFRLEEAIHWYERWADQYIQEDKDNKSK